MDKREVRKDLVQQVLAADPLRAYDTSLLVRLSAIADWIMEHPRTSQPASTQGISKAELEAAFNRIKPVDTALSNAIQLLRSAMVLVEAGQVIDREVIEKAVNDPAVLAAQQRIQWLQVA